MLASEARSVPCCYEDSDDNRGAELLRDEPAHDLRKRFAGFLKDKRSCRVRPTQLETRRQRGNPYLTNGRIRADDEARFFGLLKEHFEFFALPFDLETVLIAKVEEFLAQ
jgi:hypothetical protein